MKWRKSFIYFPSVKICRDVICVEFIVKFCVYKKGLRIFSNEIDTFALGIELVAKGSVLTI